MYYGLPFNPQPSTLNSQLWLTGFQLTTFPFHIFRKYDIRGSVETEADLLKMIQIDLTKVDYKPGNTDGVLDKLTIVAISQFQASKGMEVTGQPSPQLAEILQAEAAGTSNNEMSND